MSHVNKYSKGKVNYLRVCQKNNLNARSFLSDSYYSRARLGDTFQPSLEVTA